MEQQVIQPSTNHELIVAFLEREVGVTSDDYDTLYLRVAKFASGYSNKICVNEFNPIMLLEQVRREFDDSTPFVPFALVAADLQWGPRMVKVAEYDRPVWVLALEGFPAIEAKARAMMGGANGA